MQKLFKTILILLFFCLGAVIISGEIFASESFIANISSYGNITIPKQEIISINRNEDFCTLFRNLNEKEIQNYSNRNNPSGLSFGNQALLQNNILKQFLYAKNNIPINRIIYKISPFLKHAIYTRAP